MSAIAARFRRSAFDSFVSSSGSSTLRSAVSTGSRLYSWNTKPMCCARQRDSWLPPSDPTWTPADIDFAAARRIEAANQVQQRRLSRARRPHEREKITLRNLEVDALQHFDALVASRVVLLNVADAHKRIGHRQPDVGRYCFSVTIAPVTSVGGGETTTRSPARSPATTSTRSPSAPPVLTARRSTMPPDTTKA